MTCQIKMPICPTATSAVALPFLWFPSTPGWAIGGSCGLQMWQPADSEELMSVWSFKPVCAAHQTFSSLHPGRGLKLCTIKSLWSNLTHSFYLPQHCVSGEKPQDHKTARSVARWADKADLNTRLISSHVTSPGCKAMIKWIGKGCPRVDVSHRQRPLCLWVGLLSFPLRVFKPLWDTDHLNRKLFLFLNDLGKEKKERCCFSDI